VHVLMSDQTVVALLSPSSTPSAARTELKKLLLARNVRKTIADGIINRIFGSNGIPAISDLPAEETRQERDNVLNGSEEVGGRPATPAQDDVDVVYVCTTIGASPQSREVKLILCRQREPCVSRNVLR